MALALAACGSSTPAASAPTPTRSATSAPAPVATDSPTAAPPAGPVTIPVAGQPPVAGRPWFLTVGDSVTSGYTVDPTRAGTNSAWALQLQGMLAASGRPWTLFDTACAGERTDTYYTRCPGRSQIPFLQNASQHDVAMAAIAAHRADLRAIFVDIGSNDLLRSERDNLTLDASIAALRPAVTRIVADLRHAAPGVPVILCNFYDPLANLVVATRTQLDQVNAMLAQVAAAEGARVADFHDQVNTATAGTDTHLCDYIDCAHGDLHPTVLGHTRLAQAALAALDGR